MGLYELFEDLQKIDQKITEKNEKERFLPCDICGKPFSYADRIVLTDGICCPHCKDKVSPWYGKNLSYSGVLEIRQHIDYRDKNFTELINFEPNIEIGSDIKILIDERMKKFVIVPEGYDFRENNADLIPLNSITSCMHYTKEDIKEIFFRDSLGRTGHFTPRAFAYNYDFYVIIETNIPFMNEFRFKVNHYPVDNNQPTTIQVSKETFGNKIKDFFKTERMYQGPVNNSNEVKNSKEYIFYDGIATKICDSLLKCKADAKYNYDRSKFIICQWCNSKIDINCSTCPHCGGANN